MAGWTLTVNSHPELLEMLAGAVKSELKTFTHVTALNIAEAWVEIKKRDMSQCRLIVCSPTAPSDESYQPDLAGKTLCGVDFIRDLRELFGNQPPVIFPTALTDMERVLGLSGIENSKYMGMPGVYENLKRDIGNRVLGKNDPTLHHMDVEISLTSTSSAWTIRGTQDNPFEDGAPIDINPHEIDRLVDLCQPAAGGNDNFLRRIGADVYAMVMDPGKSLLRQRLRECTEAMGGIEFARIRFNVDERSHRILLETIAPPSSTSVTTPEFWMLKAPIYRKFSSPGTRLPLFKDAATRDAPVNCLLIEGCTDAFALQATFERSFNRIPGASQEIDWLGQWLNEDKAALGVGKVLILRRRELGAGLANAVRTALAEDDFNLVHYAGHSAVDNAGKACLVLGDKPGEVVFVDDFSLWARTVQFAYLSSCSSADSQFIVHMVGKGVPAVLGYAWPVEDEVALKFASSFYEMLLGVGSNRRLIEYSYLGSKKAVHGRWPTTSHWVAPLLFMQVSEGSRSPLLA